MIYGMKPPRPCSAAQVTAYIRTHTRARKIRLIDMGKGQEYRFGGGVADRWTCQYVDGVTQLKQLTLDEWLMAYKKLKGKNDG